jgi:trehalose-6-phosphate synthase
MATTITFANEYSSIHAIKLQVLWKNFHYQVPEYIKAKPVKKNAWNAYIKVNQRFAKTIAEIYRPGDVGTFTKIKLIIVWVNDYHLMLLPAFLRSLIPNATIGFFLHVPFPSSELFRCLPGTNRHFKR